MMKIDKPQILLTNDDGILSPGLWAAAEALSELGFVHVVAPRDQSTGAGRSLPDSSDGVIDTRTVNIRGKNWTVYAVGGTPAQAVIHGVLEVVPAWPQLVVSGINFGENVGTGVTVSGTIGAAIEAAAMEIPAIAVSLETVKENHLSYSPEVDFSAAAHFTAFFARKLLSAELPPDVDLIKLEIPSDASPETGWSLGKLSRKKYYTSLAPDRTDFSQPGKLDYQRRIDPDTFPPDSDVYVLAVERKVAVTPLSIDLTSRVSFGDLEKLLRQNEG